MGHAEVVAIAKTNQRVQERTRASKQKNRIPSYPQKRRAHVHPRMLLASNG